MRFTTPRLFAAAIAIWGTTWIAITFQLGRAPPEASVSLRFAIASVLLMGYCRLRGHPLRFPPRVHAQLALLGVFMFCLSYLAVYRAETFLVSGLVALGYSASPLVNAAISRVALGTPATRGVVVGGLLGVAGIVAGLLARAPPGAGRRRRAGRRRCSSPAPCWPPGWATSSRRASMNWA